MSSFAAQVADTEFERLDQEFVESARRRGHDALPAAEIIAIQEGKRVERPGREHGYRGPVARDTAPRPSPFRTPLPPGRAAGRAEAPAPDPGQEARRKNTIRVNAPVEPIYIEDAATGEEIVVPLRRVPSLQHGYVDAAYARLDRARTRKNRLEGRTTKDLRELDRLVGEYNAAMRDFLELQVNHDIDALFDALDIAELDALVTIVAERNNASRARPPVDGGE